METQMLGAETVVLEARESIDRNNVIKLWAFVMEDLKMSQEVCVIGLVSGIRDRVSLLLMGIRCSRL